MSGKLAEMFVEIGGNTGPLRGVLASVRSMLGGFAGGLGLAGAGIGAAGIGASLAKAISAGSDLNEVLSKTGVLFGDQAHVITDAADEMAKKFGVVKTEFIDSADRIGILLTGMGGQAKEAAVETATALTKIGMDAMSQDNEKFAGVLDKVVAGIRGESQGMSALGIDIQEAAVKEEAFRMGLVATNRDLTTQEKVTARVSLIQRGLQRTLGDLERTQSGFANSSRALWGRVVNALASVGQALLPTVETWTAGLNQMLISTQEWVDANKSAIAGWAEAFSTTVGGVAGEIGVIWRNLGAIFQSTGVMLAEWGLNVGVAVNYAATVAGTFANYIANNWVGILRDGFASVVEMIKAIDTNFINLGKAIAGFFNGEGFHFEFKPLFEGFKATIEKFPEIAKPVWADLGDQQKAIFDKMFDGEKKRLDDMAKAGAQAGKKAADAAGGAAGPPEKKKKEQAEFSSLEDFAKRIQTGIFDDKEKTAKEQLAVQKGQHVELVKARELLDKIAKQKKGLAAP